MQESSASPDRLMWITRNRGLSWPRNECAPGQGRGAASAASAGSVRAGDRDLYHLGATARADGADLFLDLADFLLFLLDDAEQAALVDLDRAGDGVVIRPDKRQRKTAGRLGLRKRR